MKALRLPIALVIVALALTACSDSDNTVLQTSAPLMIKTMALESAQSSATRLSGSIQAEHQAPLSFQIGGRITERLVDAGDQVEAGQALFALDARDLRQTQSNANVQVQAATQALSTARNELERAQKLANASFISAQALDEINLRVAETASRLGSAQAALEQANNALDYAKLLAPSDGIVTNVNAEVGQVVSAGQPVGEFAASGILEIEVFLPQGLTAPPKATVVLDNQQWQASLREVSGAADPRSQTFRARYALPASVKHIAIGTIADLLLPNERARDVKRVPIGAIDERGQGPRIWVVSDSKVEPVSVTVLSMSREMAQIKTTLPLGTPVVAMGTHVLSAGDAVQVYSP